MTARQFMPVVLDALLAELNRQQPDLTIEQRRRLKTRARDQKRVVKLSVNQQRPRIHEDNDA
jgi:hypothetical protein